ncbi:MAG: AIR synthase related protein [Nitrososphaeria archaeon]
MTRIDVSLIYVRFRYLLEASTMLLPKGKLVGDLRRKLFDRSLPMTPRPLLLNIGRQTLAVSVDPVVGVPLDSYGFFAFHYSASDVAVLGAKPRYLLLDICYPEGTDASWLGKTGRTIGSEATKFGVKVLGGHTGGYDGLNLPIISSTCIGTAHRKEILDPRKVRVGSRILIAGQLCLESAWLISKVSPDLVDEKLGRAAAVRLRGALQQLTVVKPALVARQLGATFLHDISEGGLSASLHEVARATSKSPLVDLNTVPLDEDAFQLVSSLGEDPYSASSFGALLIVSPRDKTDQILRGMRQLGEPVAECGSLRRGSGVYVISQRRKRKMAQLPDLYRRFSSRIR